MVNNLADIVLAIECKEVEVEVFVHAPVAKSFSLIEIRPKISSIIVHLKNHAKVMYSSLEIYGFINLTHTHPPSEVYSTHVIRRRESFFI